MKRLILAFPLLALLIFCVAPFIELFYKILFSGPDGTFTLAAFYSAFQVEATWTAIWNTVRVSLSVTFMSVLMALPLGWLLTRTDFPRASLFRSLLSLPFAIPPYIGAIAWIFLANPSTGLLNHIVPGGFFNVYSFWGLVLVESSFLYTFVFLSVVSSLERMDSSLEEAARLSGANAWRVFWDVSFPLIRPSLVSGALLVFLATSASFGVPALIGGPARIYLVTTQIYTFQKIGSTSGLMMAGALSSLLLLVALISLAGAQFANRRQLSTVSGKSARPSSFELGQWKSALVLAVCAFVFCVFIMPVIGILISSFSKVQGEMALSNFTFQTWKRTFFEVDETGRAIGNSLILAVSAATMAAAVGLLIGYIQVRTRLKGRGLLEVFATLPYAAPGTVLALAMILTFSGSFLGVFPSLYNTLALIGIAYTVKYLSFSVKTTADGYRQIDPVLAEAARVSGASWLKTMTTIWLPLLAPALMAAWFLVFMPALSELTMTILLTGPGLETIGTLIFQLQEYADAGGGGASVLGVSVILIVIIINLLVKRISRGRYGL